MNYGKAIKEIRESKDLRTTFLALELGISLNDYKVIESNKKISKEDLKNIALVLDVPESFINFYALEKEDIKEDKLKLYNAISDKLKDLMI